MFVLTTKSSVADKAIAALVATAMVLWGVGAHLTAEAAGLLSVTDTLTDSAPSAPSDHLIRATMPSFPAVGVAQDGDSIRLTFDAGFDLTGLTEADFDIAIDSADDVIGALGSWTFATSSQVVTFTSVGGRFEADQLLEIEIGLIAGGANQITNPAATGSKSILVEVLDGGTVVQDSAETLAFIIDQVTVTADVDPLFQFYIDGLPSGYGVNGETTTQVSSSTSVPFGTLTAGSAEIVGQQLRVITNAVGGYTVTVETDQQLTASNLADIDSFQDGSNLAAGSATGWTAPSGTINVENEYGHWGMTSDDVSLGAGDVYGASLYSAVLTTPQEVMYHTGVADGIVGSQGSTSVAYKAEIMAFQEAADDYTATLTYIATPTF